MFPKQKFFIISLLIIASVTALNVSAQEKIPSTQFEAIAWLKAARNSVSRNANGDVIEVVIDYVPSSFTVGDLEVFPNLETLTISYTEQFYDQHMSGIAKLKNLKHFAADSCEEISEASLQVLRYLPSLESVRLRDCQSIYSFDSLIGCKNLKSVDLGENTHLDFKALASLAGLEKLETLVLQENSTLEDESLKVLANFRALKSLDLSGCVLLTDAGLAELANLKLSKLDLSTTPKIEGTGFSEFDGANLTDLNLRDSGLNDQGLRELARFKQLKKLDLRDNDNIDGDELIVLGHFKKLEKLHLTGVPIRNEHLETMAGIATLKYLNLSFCSSISGQGLAAFSNCQNLETLNLEGCRRMDAAEDFQTVAKLKSLKNLNLKATRIRRESIPLLKSLQQLEILNLSDCSWVDDDSLQAIAEIKMLKRLSLNDVPRVSDAGLAYLGALSKLEYLTLGPNHEITGRGFESFLDSCPLRRLKLVGVSGLSAAGLKNLPKLKNLKSLSISDFKMTNELVASLNGMKSLTNLDLRDVSQVDDSIYRTLLASLPNVDQD